MCESDWKKNSQSKCWTFCLHPLKTLISKLLQRPASCSPDLLGPHNSQSQICPEKLTGMFQHSDGSMPRASLFITSRLTAAAAAALSPLLSLLQTLTQSGSNPYFTIQDKMECSLFALFKPLFSWIKCCFVGDSRRKRKKGQFATSNFYSSVISAQVIVITKLLWL